MKNKKYNIIFIISLMIALLLSVTGCNDKTKKIKFDNDIEIYKNDANNKDLLFYNDFYYIEYDDNVLFWDFSLIIGNSRDYKVKLDIKNPVAYGNDIKLEEEVLIKYNHDDKTKNEIFKEKSLTIGKKEKANVGKGAISFYLVIKDGNPLCKYRIDCQINNVKLSLYSYEKDYELNEFMYIHNPSLEAKVLADAEYDSNAVFGYKPNETGSLKQYRDGDWTNKEAVLEYKQNRIDYISLNDEKIKELENELKNQNKSIEEIAKACSNLRNQIRLDQYKDDPEGLANLKERNLEKYGHEEGPLPEELYEKYGSWEIVLEKCYSVNRGMDACCGVYDMYFYLYNDFAY